MSYNGEAELNGFQVSLSDGRLHELWVPGKEGGHYLHQRQALALVHTRWPQSPRLCPGGSATCSTLGWQSTGPSPQGGW